MSDAVKAKLLAKIERMELAAKRGLHLNTIKELTDGPGKLISPELCNNTLADCGKFRKWIDECFGSPVTEPAGIGESLSSSRSPAEVANVIAEALGFNVSQG